MNNTGSRLRLEATGKEVFLYSFGSIGANIFFVFVSTYLLFFYTNIMKINPLVAGTIFMTARLVDAFTDPLMGIIADRTNTRFGRYRPYLIFATPFLAGLFVSMMIVPGFSIGGKIIYAYTTYIIMGFARTAVQIAYQSVGVLTSTSVVRRQKIIAIRQLFGIIGTFLGSVMALPLLKALGGVGKANSWMKLAIIYAVLITISYWLAARGAKRLDVPRTPEIKALEARQNKQRVTIKSQFKTILSNLPLLMLVIAFGTDMLANQTSQSVNMYFFTYNLNGRTGLLTIMQLVRVIMMIGAFFVTVPIANRFGKRKAILVIEAIAILPPLAYLITGYANMPMFFISSFTSLALAGVSGYLMWMCVPDCAEYAEWKNGIPSIGVTSSAVTFTNKLMQALGGFFAGAVLAYLGFIESNPVQTQAVMNGIFYVKTLVPIFAFVASIIAMKFYPITKPVAARMEKELEERRAAAEKV